MASTFANRRPCHKSHAGRDNAGHLGSTSVFDLDPAAISAEPIEVIGSGLKRESEFLRHPVFNKYHTETRLTALYPPTRIARSFADDLDDSARLLPNQTQCRSGNAPGNLGKGREYPSLRALHPSARDITTLSSTGGLAGRDYGVRRGLLAAECGLARRIPPACWSSGHTINRVGISAAILSNSYLGAWNQSRQSQPWPGCRSSRSPVTVLT